MWKINNHLFISKINNDNNKIIWNQLFSRIPFSFKEKIKNKKKIYGIKKSLHWLRDSAEMLIYEYLYLKVKQTFLKYLAWTLGFCDALRCLYVASGSGSASASASASACVCVCVYNNFPNMHMYVYVHLHISDICRQICKYGPQYASILHMIPWRYYKSCNY